MKYDNMTDLIPMCHIIMTNSRKTAVRSNYELQTTGFISMALLLHLSNSVLVKVVLTQDKGKINV